MEENKNYGLIANVCGILSAIEGTNLALRTMKQLAGPASGLNAGGRMLIAAYAGIFIGGKVAKKVTSIAEKLFEAE